MSTTTYLILFAANLAFIVTHLYGWLLKWFYRPEAYKEDFWRLFPAARAMGLIYLLQLFELPYLLQIGDRDALLYVNAFSLLFFSLQMLVILRAYFFPQNKLRMRDYWIVIPAVVVLAPMFLQAVKVIALPEAWRPWVFVVVTVVFAAYFWRSIRMALKIRRKVRMVNEAAYADEDDFPVRMAQYLQWVPTIVCGVMALNFYLDDPAIKAIRDIIFTGVGTWFCIFTLNPRRKVFTPHEEAIIEQMEQAVPLFPEGEATEGRDGHDTPRGSEVFDDLARRLAGLLTDERIFTEPHLTSDVLLQRLGTNAAYLSEAIRRCGYQSYYDMISQHRVRHAIALIAQHPDLRLQDIADRCGFSSPSSMTKAFKAQGKEPPSSFRHRG